MKLLFLSRWFPFPADQGSKIRVQQLLRALAEEHTVDLISFHEASVDPAQLADARAICHRVVTIPYRSFRPRQWTAWVAALGRQPRSVTATFSREFLQTARELCREDSYDAVIASQRDMVPYAVALEVPVRLLEELELAGLFEQYARQGHPLRRLRYGLMWRKYRSYMRRSLPRFDGCTVVSRQERDLVRQLLPAYESLQIVPNGAVINPVLAGGIQANPVPDTMVYAGSITYQANFDAVDYYLSHIHPVVQAQHPKATLRVTGRQDEELQSALPASPGVIFTGHLEDVRPEIAASWLSVVPLRVGGGTRLKVLESMALGTPVVATPKGAEGLELVAGRDLLVAGEPAAFAEAVLRVLKDPDLRRRLSMAGRQAVQAYDWTKVRRSFVSYVEELVRRKQSPTALHISTAGAAEPRGSSGL